MTLSTRRGLRLVGWSCAGLVTGLTGAVDGSRTGGVARFAGTVTEQLTSAGLRVDVRPAPDVANLGAYRVQDLASRVADELEPLEGEVVVARPAGST